METETNEKPNGVKITTDMFDINVFFVKERYLADNSVALFAIYADGEDEGEEAFTATVCLPVKPSEGCVWLKGWSENEGVPAALVKAGIVELTGRKCDTGFTYAVEAKLLNSPYIQ